MPQNSPLPNFNLPPPEPVMKVSMAIPPNASNSQMYNPYSSGPSFVKTYNHQVVKQKFVEVPQTKIQPIIKQIPVPETLQVPVPQARQVPIEKVVERNVPVPVDVTTSLKFAMPQIVPKYNTVKEKVLVPRYIEVAVPTHMVQVDEFEHTMVPGPPMKDYEWPQYAVTDGDTQ